MLHKTKIAGLTLLISALCMQSTSSNSNAVINATKGEIEVVFRYVGESLLSCRPDRVLLQSKESANPRALLCCLNFIDCAKIIDGKIVRVRLQPKTKCGNHTFRVTDTQDAQGRMGIRVEELK